MRIAAVYDPRLVNARYRAVIPLAALQRRGHEVALFPQQDGEPQLTVEQLADFELVHVHRLIVNGDDAFLVRLREAGVAVCFDNDDDASAVAPKMWEALSDEVDPASVERVVREHERSLAQLPETDLVTTPSAVLAERFRAAGARAVQVIDNHLAPEQLRIRPLAFDGFVVGWHGGREHRWDGMQLAIEPLLQRLLDAHPHVHVVTIGLRLALDSNRYRHVEWVPFDQLLGHVAGFDVGIAPLADERFACGRSDVKLREYAAAGVPWLASAVGPYLGLGREQGGWLVEQGDWEDALDRIVRSSFERARLRRRAKGWTRRELIDAAAPAWEAAFEDAIAGVRAPAA